MHGQGVLRNEEGPDVFAGALLAHHSSGLRLGIMDTGGAG